MSEQSRPIQTISIYPAEADVEKPNTFSFAIRSKNRLEVDAGPGAMTRLPPRWPMEHAEQGYG